MIQFIILFLSVHSFAQQISITWNQEFRKEIQVSCSLNESDCLNFCNGNQFCQIEEKFCRDCIGTSIRMSNLLEHLGKEMTNTNKKIESSNFLQDLRSQKYVSLTALDVYNIIDAYRSIQVIEKFSKLCPEGSLSQILFFKVDPVSRKLLSPEVIYCEFENEKIMFEISTNPSFQINWLRQHYILK